MARAPKPDDYLELPAHALGDEPALAHLTGTGLPTFRSIYLAQRRSTPRSRMYLAAAIAAVASGPFAIVGALTGTGVALSAFVIIVVFAPLVEEMLKVAGALYLAEVRPWLVPSGAALVAVAVTSALVFAAIENAAYLWIYIDDPTPEIVRWRWVFGPLVHGTGSLLAGIRVARMWRVFDAGAPRPTFSVAAPWIIAGFIVHAGYNLFATWLEVFGGGV